MLKAQKKMQQHYQFHSKSSADKLNGRHFIQNYNPQHTELVGRQTWKGEKGRVDTPPQVPNKFTWNRWQGEFQEPHRSSLINYGRSYHKNKAVSPGYDTTHDIGNPRGIFLTNVTLQTNQNRYQPPPHINFIPGNDMSLASNVTRVTNRTKPDTRTHLLSLNKHSDRYNHPTDMYSIRSDREMQIHDMLKSNSLGTNKTYRTKQQSGKGLVRGGASHPWSNVVKNY